MDIDILSFLSIAAFLLASGAVAGTLAGILGIGGGIIVVPVLFVVYPLMGVDESVCMHLSIGTSLATIIPTSIMSARAHDKKGNLDWDLLKSVFPGLVLGVAIGTVIGSNAKGDVLTIIFATTALLISAHMLFNKHDWYLRDGLPAGWRTRGPIGLFLGCMSVIMGIGGGTFGVSIFTAYRISIHRAVGTASAIGLVIAVPGTIGYILAGVNDPLLPPFSFGYANLLGFALIVPATMITAPIGARITSALDPKVLRKLFGLFLLVVAMRMYWVLFFA